jgi:CheY-like chemotaxis protein
MNEAILLVDDDQALRETIAVALAAEGYRVASAADGSEALNGLRAGLRPDLILTDLIMPVMNGWELRNELRKDARFNRIPVVLITGYTELQPGIASDGFALTKPLGINLLLARVDEILRPARLVGPGV